MIDDLKAGKVTANDVHPIRVFEKDGRIFTLDTRRLKTFQKAEVPIRAVPVTAEEIAKELPGKFTTVK